MIGTIQLILLSTPLVVARAMSVDTTAGTGGFAECRAFAFEMIALPTYEGARGYQPMPAVGAEMDAVLADEFRDGNVPAQMAPLTLAKAAFAALPSTVSSYFYRGDSACHEKDVFWTNSLKAHFLVRLAGLNRSMKWVAFHHGYTTTDIKVRAYNQLDRWSLPKANRVLTSSGAFVGELVRMNVQANRIHVQHMPIRPFAGVSEKEKRELRKRIGCNDQTRILLSVGRLSYEKGHTDLVRSFPKIRDLVGGLQLQLLIVGEGPERPRIEKLCRSLDLSSVVTLVGQQHPIEPYYAIADLFLLPSLSEGCPNVVLEAMAAGVPVVATAVGGLPEIATNRRDAILVEKHDEAALASAAAELLKNRELRDRVVSCAHEIVSRKIPESFFRSITCVFSQVCADDH